MSIPERLPGTLLSLGDYYGSLAAARSLGSLGAPVFFADHRSLTAGGFSKYVVKRVAAPSPLDFKSYGDWLESFGKSHPGLFLYPTSDDMAYIISFRAAALSQTFALYQPSLNAIMNLLDKSRLAVKAKEVGLKMPETFSVNSIQDILDQIQDAPGPFLVKPKSQIGLLTKGKGIFCPTRAEVSAALSLFLERVTFSDQILNYDPSLNLPLLQAYHQSAVDGMLSIAGFVSRDHNHAVFLGSEKIFQRPRRLGVGIGFSARSVPTEISDRLLKLCESVGYFGVFEAEFVQDEATGDFLLVDFNPRYYGQMAFEIARGVDLPRLAYFGATQNQVAFEKEVAKAKLAVTRPEATSSKYALGWVLSLMIKCQKLGGKVPRVEYRDWLHWLEDSRIPMYDAVSSKEDKWPKRIDQFLFWKHALRHPRDFYRKFFT
ncbi:MAG: hypothetical protein WCI18_06970 [Pseudomonadota bacterium]